MTNIRMINANFRMEPVKEDIDSGHGWDVRRPLVKALLAQWKPWAITGQECSDQIRADVLADLGSNWIHYRNGHVIVMFDKTIYTHLGHATYDLPTPPLSNGHQGDPRRLMVVQLQYKKTNDKLWVVSSHFTVRNLAFQQKQAAKVVEILTAKHDIRNTIFGVDINSSMVKGAISPRGILRTGGLVDLRSKLAVGQPEAYRIKNASANSFNGWHPTSHSSEWIDDIFTGDNMSPYYARVIQTEGASDHNWIIASSVQINDET